MIVMGMVATVVAVVYAYADRGYFAVGGEYAFLFLPLLGMCVEYLVEDLHEGR